jgi:hypothetical protein
MKQRPEKNGARSKMSGADVQRGHRRMDNPEDETSRCEFRKILSRLFDQQVLKIFN